MRSNSTEQVKYPRGNRTCSKQLIGKWWEAPPDSLLLPPDEFCAVRFNKGYTSP